MLLRYMQENQCNVCGERDSMTSMDRGIENVNKCLQ